MFGDLWPQSRDRVSPRSDAAAARIIVIFFASRAAKRGSDSQQRRQRRLDAGPRDDDQVDALGKFGTSQAERLAQQPFPAVADHGAAQRREAETPSRGCGKPLGWPKTTIHRSATLSGAGTPAESRRRAECGIAEESVGRP